MIDFQEVSHELHLQDHPYFGPTFSWSNKQIENFLSMKLDRVLINPLWFEFFNHSFAEFLASGSSDHCLALVNLNKEIYLNKPKPFKIFNCWTLHHNFLNIVSQSWYPPCQGNPMKKLFLKLKRLKSNLKQLNKESFSDISARVREKHEEIEKHQLLSLRGLEPIEKELRLQGDLNALEEAEAMFLKQKAKTHWLKEGDKNSKFLYSVIATKNKKDTIRAIIDDQGRRLDTFEDMSAEFINFFKNLIGSTDSNVTNYSVSLLKDLLNHIPKSDNYQGITNEVTSQDIYEAIYSQSNDKAIGPDGYTSLFFKKAWPVIGEEVIEAIKFFFKESFIYPAFNATSIALVPKIPNPSKIISPNQSVFVKGRSIVDNNLLAQDIVKGYGRKNISPRCVIKIDLQKAFDSVHWGIIPIILKALDLPTSLIDWIVSCYSNASYSIAFNGSLIGFFKGAKGLRQGNLESVLGIITVLNSFYELSGLKLNALKSEIFTAGISAQVIDKIISYSGFKHGLLPVRHLGIPLVTWKLSPKDCQPLLDKIYSRLNQWSRMKLSYAGRIELVKTVLFSVANF
ncbi:uncharacterized protein LOC120140931 [Hibiscus syriacus]|uniref:uncharacterized protein LOC120140931 n=1 Tax=Hibiscus syriacus TaxID=106335 RepID=UPI001923A9AF|nr:uncharacterized protein LOC120140931 [Hibiscus syriacus]